MRIRLKGINSVRKKRADGSVETYYYAWKGGARIRGELGSPEFIASYNEAAARKVVTPIGTLVSLCNSIRRVLISWTSPTALAVATSP